MERKDYNDILIKYYTENHSFIEKAVFTVTASAITFLLGYSDKIHYNYILLYALCIFCFIITLFIQLFSAHVSREGCDLGLDEVNDKEAQNKFNFSRSLNSIFLVLFCLSIFLSFITIMLNSNIKLKSDSENYLIETTIEQENYNYYERRMLMNKKTCNNGLNPPKSIRTSPTIRFQDGFNPPKTTQPKPSPTKPQK